IATDVAAGRGTHELLCQRIEGQHMQLRITLASDGDVTPRLRALRASWPRQSWAQRYLPGVYLEAPEPADFLTRYLSNMQGITSRIEAAIIAAEHLLDTRTAPQEALPWLAGWFDVALDPAWGEARSRAFIAHAVTFFGWRGTMKGVESALALAFGQPLGGTLFGSKDCRCEGAIRIVETFRTRRLGRIGAGDSSSIADAEIIDPGLAEQGAWRAFQTGLGRSASAAMASLPRLSVPGGHAQDWAAFLLRTSPARQYWQRFLTGRYRRIDALNDAHGSGWNSFGEVALNDAAAATAAGRADWGAFTAGLMPIARTAHRFSVLLPVGPGDATDAETLEGRRRLAARIVDLEKPAHTIFDVRFYFAMNRIGEARLGMDTTLGAGSRSADTLPPALLGRAWLGESFVGPDGPALPDGADLNASRTRLSC
ncbi:phage tail protein, partial [Sandarakinorhabdus sp.]|uniref:phage tail protein n=1 Tax=Sandarakinorhabdus sp. TaxID=1916663 RepID=UPI00286DD5F1